MELCRRSEDFTDDPYDDIRPLRAEISVRLFTFAVLYDLKRELPEGTTFLLYVNKAVVDRENYSGKTYTFVIGELSSLVEFVVIPVAPGVDTPDYDPLCGQTVNMFPIVKDIALPEDGYIWQCDPKTDEYKGNEYDNFISPERGAEGLTVTKGMTAKLVEGRRRLVDRKFVEKPAGPNRKVLGIRDYRFAGGFDKKAWIGDPKVTYRCRYVPARPAVKTIRIAEGDMPVTDVEMVYGD